ncbi:MAG TPA: hypothetical protein DCY88_08000 [Cyanobacteria bacterium UBA11372]|nr:hypothetical protein [Cyanobacteria bacterium UBA11372]
MTSTEKAAWWIDNRNGQAVSKVRAAIDLCLKNGYPTKEWIEFEPEYSHEGYGGQYEFIFEGEKWYPGADDFAEKIGIFKNPESGGLEVWHSYSSTSWLY